MRLNKFEMNFKGSTSKITRVSKTHAVTEACEDASCSSRPVRKAELPAAYSNAQSIAMYTNVITARSTVR